MRRIDPRTRLRLRRHWRLPLALVILGAGLVVFGAGVRIQPYVATGGARPPETQIENIRGTVDLFDPDQVHRIEVSVDPDDRQRMLETYRETNEKIVIDATVRIDGTTVPGAGIRLKGNSSLAGLIFDGEGGDIDGFEEFDRLLNECLAERGVDDAIVDSSPPDPGEGDGGPPAADQPFDGVEFDEGSFPESLHPETGDDAAVPYLLVLNHHNRAQRYQGLSQIALRTDGGGTILAEPVSIAAHRMVGIPAPRTALTGLSINDEPERLYGMTAVMDDEYIRHQLGGVDGALYKATAAQSQDFSYQGPDESNYLGFDQVTGRGRYDRRPLVDLIKFVAEGSDDELARRLPEHVDTEALARLLAINNLLVNSDSLGTGPGGNYYLFYDAARRRIVPLGWDWNFSLGGLDGFNTEAPTDPLTSISPWLAPGEGDAGVDDVGAVEAGGQDPFDYCLAQVDASIGDSLQPVDGETIEVAPGEDDPGAAFVGGPSPDVDPDDPTSWIHPLVVRSLAIPEVKARYATAYRELYHTLLGSGDLRAELDRQVEVVERALTERPSLADPERFATQQRALATFIDQRTIWLGDNLPQ